MSKHMCVKAGQNNYKSYQELNISLILICDLCYTGPAKNIWMTKMFPALESSPRFSIGL